MTPERFKLSEKQKEAIKLFSLPAMFFLLYGGSRSSKTFTILRTIVTRALAAPNSRHAVLRFRFNHVKTSVVHDTFPKMMALCYPQVKYKLDKTDWFAEFPNGSQIWFGGLDDKERTEKILGNEYVSIFLNEISQISYSSYLMMITRLAQRCFYERDGEKQEMRLMMFLDENPPKKGHWSYKLFIQKRDPDTKKELKKPENYQFLKMNPVDNAENLSSAYLESLINLPPKEKRRFFDGEFADDMPDQLFSEESIDKWRVTDGDKIPELIRVIVGVDPSGSDDEDNADNDAIGIIVGGLGTDGNAYLLEDCTVKAGPHTWGNIATSAYDRHEADKIVGEQNYGGAMVQHVIKTSNPRANYGKVNATRGKHIRAEPFSALYEQGKVRHVGYFHDLEDEMTAFSTHGYMGDNSPNRADAWIWVLAELFPGMTRQKQNSKPLQYKNRYVV